MEDGRGEEKLLLENQIFLINSTHKFANLTTKLNVVRVEAVEAVEGGLKRDQKNNGKQAGSCQLKQREHKIAQELHH